jgi:uncharacterized cofD-like protein
MVNNATSSLQQLLQGITRKDFCPLDFLAKGSLTERVISLVLGEVPPSGVPGLNQEWQQLIASLRNFAVTELRVVVFGGGTGLSNIVGGDSRRPEWPDSPFTGLKELFPKLHSIVCVTDDGGSTGEILKDFPLVALGDLRHVLLSSICSETLKHKYRLDDQAAMSVAAQLHALFNYRFISPPASAEQLLADTTADFDQLPVLPANYLRRLVKKIFCDQRMLPALERPQCLGNLLLAAAIYEKLPQSLSREELISDRNLVHTATMQGLAELSGALGAGELSVLPCTTTSAQLQMLYANGVMVTSECKSGSARRGYPVERVLVEFSDEPQLPDEVEEIVRKADVIIMAPGSLYTSIIPILQVPGLADLIRQNTTALKLLVANIWVQKGETDATREAPDRKFHVSDLILAYDHNISGGVQGLFSHILTLDLADIPGSVLQNYVIEKKEPIYLDRGRVRQLGIEPVEAYIFSRELLQQRNVIQHDPASFSLVVQVLCGLRAGGFLAMPADNDVPPFSISFVPNVCKDHKIPCLRYEEIIHKLKTLDFKHFSLHQQNIMDMENSVQQHIFECVTEIIWRHPDIHPDHFKFIRGICLIDTGCWKRCQEWDNVFSFYDPDDGYIKIRRDQSEDLNRLEMAFLVGLGQSLLGNYVEEKRLENVFFQNEKVGRIYCLTVKHRQQLSCFFSADELDEYLNLCRMYPLPGQNRFYTRVVSGEEGFTPPGLLFGLFFVWYLDNRFAPNIDYKMSIMKNELSYLIPEQVKIVGRRKQLIRFFREVVFRRHLPKIKLTA